MMNNKINQKFNCNKCTHSSVCMYKENVPIVDVSIANTDDIPEKSPFVITMNCNQYVQRGDGLNIK